MDAHSAKEHNHFDVLGIQGPRHAPDARGGAGRFHGQPTVRFGEVLTMPTVGLGGFWFHVSCS